VWGSSLSSIYLSEFRVRHNPEDEDGDGLRNVGLFTVQPLDPADNPKELHCMYETVNDESGGVYRK
jgi:hypothetical protein